MKLRPKEEIRLLVEQAFRMTWAANNTLQVKMGHLSQRDTEGISLFFCLAHVQIILQMLPEGSTRNLSFQPKSHDVASYFAKRYNEHIQEYLDVKKRALPITLEITKLELSAAIQIDRITDFIIKTFQQ